MAARDASSSGWTCILCTILFILYPPASTTTATSHSAYYTDFNTLVHVSRNRGELTCSINSYKDSRFDHPLDTVITKSGDIEFLKMYCNEMAPHRQKRFIFYPGTKWCGIGDRAKHYNDLGRHRQTDACCRTHDKCRLTIRPWRSRFGIWNYSPFVWSHCDCDTTFWKCLKNAGTRTANIVGNLYFNVGRFFLKCFKRVSRRGCLVYGRSTGWWFWKKKKCVKYGMVSVMKRFNNPTY